MLVTLLGIVKRGQLQPVNAAKSKLVILSGMIMLSKLNDKNNQGTISVVPSSSITVCALHEERGAPPLSGVIIFFSVLGRVKLVRLQY
jgi:hypothetical protein